MAAHNELGKWGEEQAVAYLKRHGYFIRNVDWRYGHRDLDIVALTPDTRTLVFFEVKTRTTTELSKPEDAIDRNKIRNIGYAANSYILQNNIVIDARFDIITVVGSVQQGEPMIEHVEDAFNPLLL